MDPMTLVVVVCMTWPSGLQSCQALPAYTFGAATKAECIAAAKSYRDKLRQDGVTIAEKAKVVTYCARPTPDYQRVE